MELSLARELLSWELSTISTAARRSRQRDESLPAISRRGISPEKRKTQRDADAREGTTPTRGPSLGAGGLADTVHPTLPGSGIQDLNNVSLTPQARSETPSPPGQKILQ